MSVSSASSAAAASGGGREAGVVGDGAPCETLYIKNLNEHPRRAALKRALYTAFSQFDRVISVQVRKTKALKGQAWVSFASTKGAATARRQLQGFTLLGKPMHISFAKEEADAVRKQKGTYVPRYKRSREEAGEVGGAEGEGGAKRAAKEGEEGEGATLESAVPTSAPAPSLPVAPSEPPHSTLFVQNLAADTTKEALVAVFGKFANMKDVRVPPGGRGVAFVEFRDIPSATSALLHLHNFELQPEKPMVVSYAKK